MIRIENIVLGMCATNCYAVFDGGAKTPGGYVDDGQLKEAVIIDPAADAACIYLDSVSPSHCIRR